MHDDLEPDDAFELSLTDVLDLHSFPPSEVADVVRSYLEVAQERGWPHVRIIHGKGSGVQRRTVREILERDPHVAAYSDASGDAGGWGATLVTLLETTD